jgi:hypothetical protein
MLAEASRSGDLGEAHTPGLHTITASTASNSLNIPRCGPGLLDECPVAGGDQRTPPAPSLERRRPIGWRCAALGAAKMQLWRARGWGPQLKGHKE